MHFGSSSVLAIFCNRLLHCFNFHQYLQTAFEIEKEIEEHIMERSKITKLACDFDLRADDLRVMLSPYDGDPSSNYYIDTTCSNHIESMHGIINHALCNCHTFQLKLTNLIDCSTNHFVSFPQRFGKSIKR